MPTSAVPKLQTSNSKIQKNFKRQTSSFKPEQTPPTRQRPQSKTVMLAGGTLERFEVCDFAIFGHTDLLAVGKQKGHS